MAIERRGGATIRDVARLAGVSHQTVSRVLNQHPNISRDARDRVEQAIDQLSYRPSTIARALATNRSRTIGVICTDNGHFGPPKTLGAIESAARDAGYFTAMANLVAVTPSTMREALTRLTAQGIEGLVIIAPQIAMLDALARFPLHIPYVTVEPTRREGVHTRAIDQAEGARLATRHLIDLGHERIGHVSGPVDWLDSQTRVAAWQQTLAEAGLQIRRPLVGDWSIERGRELARTIAAEGDLTAVFASNDHTALGLMVGFAELGLRVPHDVSVVGFDDIPEAAYFSPPLTTIRPDFAELGRRCIGLLVDGIEGSGPDDVDEAPLLAPELVVRLSTAPPDRDGGMRR